MVKAFVEAHDEYQGITTLDEFKDRVINDSFQEARDAAYYNTVDEVMDYLLTHSDFEFDEDELRALDEEAINFVTEELSSEGKTLEALGEKECMGLFGASGADEVKEMISINSEREIGTALVIAKMNDIDVREIPYEEFADKYFSIKFIDDYLKDVLNIEEER
jgi:hypothetical protein